jgi:hypothetical protein
MNIAVIHFALSSPSLVEGESGRFEDEDPGSTALGPSTAKNLERRRQRRPAEK